MAIWDQFRDEQTMQAALGLDRPRLIRCDVSLVVHDRSADGTPCPCPCGSTLATVVDRRHVGSVLIDRVSGVHRRRTAANREQWERLAADAELVPIALPCYEAQVQPILDRHHKAILIFGGNRAGKTEIAKCKIVIEAILYGGRGVILWWVAPSQELTRIAVEKLVTGSVTDHHNRPAIPSELVRYWPASEKSHPQAIVLVTGTRIELRYASRQGNNLKGRAPRMVALDEGTSVAHEINWKILVNRLLDSRGQIVAPTTPVAGHWLRKYADRATAYSELVEGVETPTVRCTITCLDNPWISADEVRTTIDALGGPDDPGVRREVFGEWVTPGQALWRHWSRARHTLEGPWLDLNRFGFVNVTPKVIGTLFGRPLKRQDHILGWDCNDYPQSVVVAHVVVREGDDESDVDRWILFVRHELIRRASVHEYTTWLAERSHVVVGQRPGWLHGSGLVGDPATLYAGTRVSNPGIDADAMRDIGITIIPPTYSQDGHPMHPRIRDRVSLMHRLMHRSQYLVHGSCRQVIEATEGQRADARGLPVKVSATASDRLSGPLDAVGYLAYAVFFRPHEIEISV